jgi:dihydrofolate reductase
MSATVLYMSMSVDGFIAGPNEGPNNGLGDGGERLHDWLWSGNEPGSSSGVPGRPSGVNGQIYDEFMSTCAVVAGRGTFEPAGGWGGDHHDGVPIFVVARHEPRIDISRWPLVSYVDDVTTAMAKAKEAAGDKNVLVHGAGVTRLALAAACWTSSSSTSSPSSSARAACCSRASLPSRSSCRAPASSRARTVTHLHYRVQR